MLKFGTPTIALPLAIKKCTVQTGCTVYIRSICSDILVDSGAVVYPNVVTMNAYVVGTTLFSKQR